MSYAWEGELPALASLSAPDAADAINAMVLAPVLIPMPKTAFAHYVSSALRRVYGLDPGFRSGASVPYWMGVLSLWGTLDAIDPNMPETNTDLGQAETDGVLLPAEVAAIVASVTITPPKYPDQATPGEVSEARGRLS
jgi:hypothetical protein